MNPIVYPTLNYPTLTYSFRRQVKQTLWAKSNPGLWQYSSMEQSLSPGLVELTVL